jgi:pimeloyl-ACP methyl ester carboxylesterase
MGAARGSSSSGSLFLLCGARSKIMRLIVNRSGGPESVATAMPHLSDCLASIGARDTIRNMLKRAEAGQLEIAYEESGSIEGKPTVLLHGFPYDVRADDEVSAILAGARCHVIVPYLRGFGPTRFLSKGTLRSGQQAVLAHDLLALLDALEISQAILAGYDWGGRAACIVAALWPERVRGLASQGGYNIQDISGSQEPRAPESNATAPVLSATRIRRRASSSGVISAWCSDPAILTGMVHVYRM